MMTSPIPVCFNMPNKSFLSKYQVSLPNAVSVMATSKVPSGLPEHYQVGPNDVVCGRGKGSYNRPGNKKFRLMVQDHVQEYVQAKTKLDKSMVLSAIVEKVREENGGRFVKQKKGVWHEIGDEQAREKVGHAIREAIAAGEKKSASPVPPAAAAAPTAAADTSDVFQAKHSDLLSAQLSIFEGLVARSSPVPSSGNDNDGFPWAAGPSPTYRQRLSIPLMRKKPPTCTIK